MKKLLLLVLLFMGLQTFTACTHHSSNDKHKTQVQQADDCCGDTDTDDPPEDEG